MKCPKCNKNTVFDYPFVRMDEPGPKAKGIFWCEPCAEKHEPELYKNQIEDEGEATKLLKSWAYKK
jgi:hypothetical protein